MTTQLVDLVPGTPITLGSNSNTALLTLKNLANGSYVQSAKFDVGANFAQEFAAWLATKFAAAATAGNTVRVWIGYSASATAGTANWANCTGADGAYTGYSGGTAAQSVLQLDFVGQLILDANATQAGRVGSFVPRQRYGYVVVLNGSGQALTNVDADHTLTLQPIDARIEAAV